MSDTGYKRCTRCGITKPLTRFYRDRKRPDGRVGDCKDCRSVRQWTSGRQARRRAERDRKSESQAADRAARVAAFDPAFGHWLAGFIDGEGCFEIARRDRAGRYTTYEVRFSLRIRDDDLPALKEILQRLDIGRIGGHAHSSHPNTNPSACWMVQAKHECQLLAELLDRFPLRAKKRHDFAIWREAVEEAGRIRQRQWQRADWSRLEELHRALGALRIYQRGALDADSGCGLS
jgi:hypothetical protein